MTHARTMQSFIAVHALNKLCILILLCKLHSHETKAHGAGLQHGTNESDYHCPSFNDIRLRWHEFHPFTHYNSSSNILEGLLVDFMRIAVSMCCPIVQITGERINVTNSYDMEILIRKYNDDNPTVHFPIFSNRGEEQQFDRRFIGLFDSPGPAVLKFSRGLDSSSLTGFPFLLKNTWKLMLSWYGYVGFGMCIIIN